MKRRHFILSLLLFPLAKLAFGEDASQRVIEAEDYCFDNSLVLRRYKRESKWAIRKSIEYLPDEPEEGRSQWSYRAGLHEYLRKEARAEFSGIVLWILLYVVLPIIVKLIIEWFFHRRMQ